MQAFFNFPLPPNFTIDLKIEEIKHIYAVTKVLYNLAWTVLGLDTVQVDPCTWNYHEFSLSFAIIRKHLGTCTPTEICPAESQFLLLVNKYYK